MIDNNSHGTSFLLVRIILGPQYPKNPKMGNVTWYLRSNELH